LSIGGTLAILPGTWLARNQKELGVEWLEGPSSITNGKNHLWKIEATGNDYPTRLRRLTEFMEEAKKQGFTVVYSVVDPQKELENEINKRMDANESSTITV
jgi:hypothetical protein